MEEFLTSPSVYIIIDGLPKPILITDYTFEVSDNPGNEVKFKFEWQFANQREDLFDLEQTDIFSPEYTEPFE